MDGASDGATDGTAVGAIDGALVGASVGAKVLPFVGASVGAKVPEPEPEPDRLWEPCGELNCTCSVCGTSDSLVGQRPNSSDCCLASRVKCCLVICPLSQVAPVSHGVCHIQSR